MTMDRNTVFSALMALTAIGIIVRLIPPSVEPVMAMTLSKNRVNIEKINQPRDVSATRKLMIDRVTLHHKNRFSHPALGALGWADHFFADITSRFRVDKTQRYRFLVGSDDGFRLRIDGRVLCQYPGDRPYRKQSCYRTLTAGEHTLELNYFQGYGNAGLTLEAAPDGAKSPEYWGGAIRGIEYLPTQLRE